MKGFTHIAIGTATTLYIARHFSVTVSPSEWAMVIIGSLAPDIDSSSSWIARPGVFFSRFFPRQLINTINGIAIIIARSVSFVFGHRGFFHWPILAIGMMITGLISDNDLLCWFGFGYFLHIMADACTVGGIPLLAPLKREKISWSPLKSNSELEHLVSIMLWIYIAAVGYPLLPAETRRWLAAYSGK